MKKIILFAIFAAVTAVAAAQQTDNTQAAAENREYAYTPVADTTPEHLWEEANNAYIGGEFARAAELYECILSQGLFSAKLYYNLANACFRNGENARAILFYNRALLLSPSDEDIRYNLAVAEGLTKDSIETVPEFFLNEWMRNIRNSLDEVTWTLLSLIFMALALILGLCFLLSERTSLRKGGFFGMAASLLLFVCTTSFAASHRSASTAREGAIVMSTAAPVKSSPDRSATDIFVLHEGTKVRVVGTLDRWSEIVIADGKKGWIESDKIERI